MQSFIGYPAAAALVRAGHHIYGTTRDAAKGKTVLAANEIVPVLLDTIDVVIDTVPAHTPEVPLAAFNLVAAAKRDAPGTKITYIYTGGSWVHARPGAGLDAWSSETQAHTGHVQLTAWRWEIEKEVLSSDRVHGIVIRPSVLYGRGGSLLAPFVFDVARHAVTTGTAANFVAEADSRLLVVHQDDLADLYVRVAERGNLLSGQALLGANPQSERPTDFIDAATHLAGVLTYTIRPPAIAFEAAWASTTRMRPTLAQALTGWVPRKLGVVDGIDIYWAAYMASLEDTKA
ncbi:hypothetical protein Q5752_005031 [Cryptotrichosporon argae]